MHSTKSENPTSPASPNALKALVLASRPKTWTASLCPVFIGAAMAAKVTPLSYGTLLLTLLFALFIQIGTNFANDAFDFLKGADTAKRKGPKRAVQQGWIAPHTMLIATGLTFAAACLFALPLMMKAGLWSFGLAGLCVLLGILYTGGPKPLGYAGLGEILVLLFFGPIAVLGTYFLQTGTTAPLVLLASLPPGLISAAILMANNLRDITTDRFANKRTLVVRFGASFGKAIYLAFLFGSFLIPLFLKAPLPLLALPFVPFRKLFRSQEVLQETSLLLLLYTFLFCLA